MTSGTVVSMAAHTHDGKRQSPTQALESALKDIQDGHIWPNNILILSLTKGDGEYTINFHQAGMSCSDMVLLCEIAKCKFLQEMGY